MYVSIWIVLDSVFSDDSFIGGGTKNGVSVVVFFVFSFFVLALNYQSYRDRISLDMISSCQNVQMIIPWKINIAPCSMN